MKTILKSVGALAMMIGFITAGYAASLSPMIAKSCNQSGLGCSDNGCAIDGGTCQNFTPGGQCGCSYAN